MKQKVNHARSKQKRKALRLKNFFSKVLLKRHQKKIDALKPKGKTIYGKALEAAHRVSHLFNVGNNHGRYLNQRQKRKRAAQTR